MIQARLSTPRLIVCLATILWSLTGAAQAQVVDDTGTWLAVFADGDIESAHSERFKWWFDGQLRFFDDTDGFGSPIRIEAGYLNQYVDRATNPDVSNHLLSINLFLSL